MTERAKHWRRVLWEWERSGLSQAAFCRERGIQAGTLAWWKRQLRQAGVVSRSDSRRRAGGQKRRRSSAARAGFVEVQLSDGARIGGYEVVVSRGRVIRVPGDFDSQSLSRLIAAVESC